VLILLPPSEGKFSPRRGGRLDLATLSYPALQATRHRVLCALVELCQGNPERARAVLGLTTGQAEEVARDAALLTAPTAPAGRIYSGVLYETLGLESRSAVAKRRAATRVAVTSGLFGLLRFGDRIPSYRLSGSTSLPGLGAISSTWRRPLGEVLRIEASRGLVVDLRSGTYAGFWRPPPGSATNFATVRILQEKAGVRSVVSHANKATKGHLVASLLEDGANPTSVAGLATALARLGWRVEPVDRDQRALDVIVSGAG
jgi:cytoplasmic iron level regulating protein YaaA (DUF328/UPF0246 family)